MEIFDFNFMLVGSPIGSQDVTPVFSDFVVVVAVAVADVVFVVYLQGASIIFLL